MILRLATRRKPTTHRSLMPDLSGDLVGRLTAALLAEPWNSWPKSAHGEHRFDSGCAICQCDVVRIAAFVVRFMEPEVLAAEVDAFHAEGDLRDQIAETLRGYSDTGGKPRVILGTWADLADAVLPVVQAWAAEQTQRAVEAAKDAADETWNRVGVDTLAHWTQRAEWAERERDEARALAARYRMQVDDPDSLLTRLDKAEATVQRAGLVQTVLALFDSADIHSELFWRTDEDDIRLYANVSDIFAWGTADLEEITTDRLSILQRAYDDLIAIDSAAELAVLYAARVRGQRPQGAAYPDHPTARTLLDECGPERPLGLDNPRPPAALDQPEEASDGR